MIPAALRLCASIERAAAEGDDRRFSFVCSTETLDRNGRIVVQDWELDDFKKNPIVLWNHGEGGSFWGDIEIDEYFPIGRAENVRVEKNTLLADLIIATGDVNPLAERVYQALKQGVLNAVSVGWSPRDRRYELHDDEEVLVVSGNRLLEISVVPFPANPEAVRASFCASARAETKGIKDMKLLAMMVAAFGLAATATEEEVAERGRELADLDRAAKDATKAPDTAAAKAAVVVAADKASRYDELAAKVESEAKASAIARNAAAVEAARRDLRLTPANEKAMLRAFCNDETGLSAKPEALAQFLQALPPAANVTHATTPADAAPSPTGVRVTPRDEQRAAKSGGRFTAEELAAERARMKRETSNVDDEEG